MILHISKYQPDHQGMPHGVRVTIALLVINDEST